MDVYTKFVNMIRNFYYTTGNLPNVMYVTKENMQELLHCCHPHMLYITKVFEGDTDYVTRDPKFECTKAVEDKMLNLIGETMKKAEGATKTSDTATWDWQNEHVKKAVNARKDLEEFLSKNVDPSVDKLEGVHLSPLSERQTNIETLLKSLWSQLNAHIARGNYLESSRVIELIRTLEVMVREEDSAKNLQSIFKK